MNNREIAEAILASDQYESGLVDAITQALDEKDRLIFQMQNAAIEISKTLRETEAQIATLRGALEIIKSIAEGAPDFIPGLSRPSDFCDAQALKLAVRDTAGQALAAVSGAEILGMKIKLNSNIPNDKVGFYTTEEDGKLKDLVVVEGLATSKDTEGCVRDRGYFPASAVGNEAEPSGPYIDPTTIRIGPIQRNFIEEAERNLKPSNSYGDAMARAQDEPSGPNHSDRFKALLVEAEKKSRKELNAEVAHLWIEQEQYAKELSELRNPSDKPLSPEPNLGDNDRSKEAVFKWGLQTIDRLIERHFDTEDQANIVGASFNKQDALEALVIEIATLNEKLLHDEDFEPPISDNDRVMDLIRELDWLDMESAPKDGEEIEICFFIDDDENSDNHYFYRELCKWMDDETTGGRFSGFASIRWFEEPAGKAVAWRRYTKQVKESALPPHLIEQARGK